MFNKFALLFAGLMLTCSSVGCCLGYGYNAGYGARGCAPCNQGCPPAGGGGGYYPQTGAFYNGMDTTQTAYMNSGMTTTALAPIANGGYTTTTASAFTPTTTAAAPGPIMGQPIYLNAGAPVNSLPTY